MIKILFFASLKDEIGTSHLNIDLNNVDVGYIKQHLLENYNIKSFSQTMVAVNEVYAKDNFIIKHGDTVAFIPPVSGG